MSTLALTLTRTDPGPTDRPADASLLASAFALFGMLRIVAYLPTLQTIHASGASDQHSLFSWLTFLGANVTMALWLHRGNGGRLDCAVLLSGLNALMCIAICLLIPWTRLAPTLPN